MNSPAPRPPLLPAAALVSLLVLLLGVTGLFVLSYSNTQASAALARLQSFHTAQVDAVRAQVSFKTQVQEWKNLLLRGTKPSDFTTYHTRFEQREAEVQSGLAALQSRLAPLAIDASVAARLAHEHTALGAAYRQALTHYRPAEPASGFAVDTSIRGIDRAFNDELDALARTVEIAADAEFAAYRTAAATRYASLRRVTLGVGALAVLASFWLVFQAARPAIVRARTT